MDDQMVMIVHQDKAMKADAKSPDHVLEQFQEMSAVAVVAKDRAPLVATRGDVVPSASMLNA
jgi:hypothetical protein